MNKLKKLWCFAGLALLLCFSCVSGQGGTGTYSGRVELSSEAKTLVKDAVFEVVLEKPDTEADPLIYEKELDWDAVPYQIRTDKYYSIGTAFAISPTELITAFHVINLGIESAIYKKYYVRDSKGGVFEIDQVTGGNNERDFLVFTIKDHPRFTRFFEFDTAYEDEQPVFSIGNALGEGIVRRNGLILGTVPEAESGRWQLLKSSADGNPGNSGGPLVSPEGKVLGLVTSLRDNILYSTPASVIVNYPRDMLRYRIKPGYAHVLLSNKLVEVFECSVPLPANYKAVQRDIVSPYKTAYVQAMTKLFNQAPAYLTGENNAYLFNASMSSIFPQVDFVDRNDDNWKLARSDIERIDLNDDGKLLYAHISEFDLFKIVRPKTVPLDLLDTDPRFIMDLILRNWRLDRTLWGANKYRIFSLGDPNAVETYIDAVGRTWVKTSWLVPFDNKVLIAYILPLPGGPVMLSSIQSTDEQFVYEWDMEKICNHIHAAYSGTFTEWDDFLQLDNYIPDFLTDFSFNWDKKDKKIAFSFPTFSITAENNIFDWSDISELYMLPSFYQIDKTIGHGITKLVINQNSREQDFLVLAMNSKPDPRLGSNYREDWEDLIEERFPFNGKPAISLKDNNGTIGTILPAKIPNENVRWTLYMSVENPTEADLTDRFNQLKKDIVIDE
ncbi:MAG: serine protease [Spirochaetaceae bacterium]|jgi:hypothetical protein|nr:serine protease [Spirochaetaceae bacterium]